MEYIQEIIIGIIINNSFPSTFINYVTCAKSKVIYVILRKISNKEEFPEAEAIFIYNIIYKKKVYNKDIFYLYLQDFYIGFNFIYSHKKFGDSFSILERVFKKIRNLYEYRLKVIYFDNERTF